MTSTSLKRSLVASAVAFSFVFSSAAALGTFLPTANAQEVSPTQLIAALPDFSKLVEDNGKAVVSIETLKKAKKVTKNKRPRGQDPFEELRKFGFPFPFGDDFPSFGTPERHGQGSGFIISPDGYILTNHHVVDGADELTVHLTDKRKLKAKVIGSDQKTDVAVIKIEAKDLPTVKIGNSDKVKVGEWVAAIGAPFGLDNTVTAGIVSAKSRNLPDDQFVPFIQTDVAVNPGNSGGPLFNMKGEVIGINSQIFSTSGGFMGLSFAIPIDLAIQIKDQLIKDGKVSRGRIGVMMQAMTPELAKSFGLKDEKGALVVQIEEKGPAEKAGMKEGDVIIEFNGQKIDEMAKLSQAVAATKPGSKVKVIVLREGKPTELTMTVYEMPVDGKLNFKNTAPSNSSVDRLGLSTRPLNDLEKKKHSSGIVVDTVEGPAAEAGIQTGDIILSAGGKKLKTADDLKKVLEKAGTSIPLLIDRKGQRIFVPVPLETEKK